MRGKQKQSTVLFTTQKKESVENFRDDVRRLINRYYPDIYRNLDNYLELVQVVLTKLYRAKFPSCVKDFPRCPDEKIYNYLETTVRNCCRDYFQDRDRRLQGFKKVLEDLNQRPGCTQIQS